MKKFMLLLVTFVGLFLLVGCVDSDVTPTTHNERIVKEYTDKMEYYLDETMDIAFPNDYDKWGVERHREVAQQQMDGFIVLFSRAINKLNDKDEDFEESMDKLQKESDFYIVLIDNEFFEIYGENL